VGPLSQNPLSKPPSDVMRQCDGCGTVLSKQPVLPIPNEKTPPRTTTGERRAGKGEKKGPTRTAKKQGPTTTTKEKRATESEQSPSVGATSAQCRGEKDNSTAQNNKQNDTEQ